MNTIEKSESIRDGLRKGFQSGTSKLAQRKCYGYDVGPDGELTIKPDEAAIVRWIFDQYLSGSSLGAIVADLKKKGVLSPTGKPKWNREALNKLNESFFSNIFIEKRDSSYASVVGTQGFPIFALMQGISEKC